MQCVRSDSICAMAFKRSRPTGFLIWICFCWIIYLSIFFSLLIYQLKWLMTETLYCFMINLHLLGSVAGRILKKHWWHERSPCHFRAAWPYLAGNMPGVPAGQSWLSSSETNTTVFLITGACSNTCVCFFVRSHLGLDHLKHLYIKATRKFW